MIQTAQAGKSAERGLPGSRKKIQSMPSKQLTHSAPLPARCRCACAFLMPIDSKKEKINCQSTPAHRRTGNSQSMNRKGASKSVKGEMTNTDGHTDSHAVDAGTGRQSDGTACIVRYRTKQCSAWNRIPANRTSAKASLLNQGSRNGSI